MKDFEKKITVKGKEYPVVFNLNVMEEIQNEYGTLEKWGELTDGGETGEPNAKAVIFGFTHMINEGIDIHNEEDGTDEKPLTYKQVGRMLTEIGLDEMAKTMHETVIASTESAEKNA